MLNFLGLYISSRETINGLTKLNQNTQLNASLRNFKELNRMLQDKLGEQKIGARGILESIGNQVDTIFENLPLASIDDKELKTLLTHYKKKQTELKKFGETLQPREPVSKSQMLVIEQLILEISDIVNQTQLAITASSEETIEAVYNARFFPITVGILLTAIFLAFAIGKGIKLHSHFERSIQSLLAATRAAAEGDFSGTAQIISNDEIGQLTYAFNKMTKILRESTVSRDLLTSANKSLEAFSYSVSHDLRSPLRAVDGFSLALIEDYSDKLDDEGKRYLTRIRNAIQKMGKLIDDMLDLSRLSQAEITITRVDLSTIVRNMAKELKESDPNRVVDFHIQGGIEVNADGGLIKIALQNLMTNAWKYTSKHTRARIEFGKMEVNGQTTYFVRDDGAGFDMTYKEKLFGPFQRLHKETEFPGTGVGLATVQRVIARHNGKIWADSEVEKGATFYFTL